MKKAYDLARYTIDRLIGICRLKAHARRCHPPKRQVADKAEKDEEQNNGRCREQSKSSVSKIDWFVPNTTTLAISPACNSIAATHAVLRCARTTRTNFSLTAASWGLVATIQ
ncbi:hypothetical protein [Caballeronia glebae]|uniref:hypothetical protein n=1 Tax=Caballeronia glebae TaxID=1777143 RepID=UPI0038B75024